MKIKKQKSLHFIFAIVILSMIIFLNIEKVYATTKESEVVTQTVYNTNEKSKYTVMNSQTLMETSTLDTLVLNYTSLPIITVSGSEKYKITNETSLINNSVPVRQVQFPEVTSGKILDSVITVKFNHCGTLNGKSIDMKLIYSDIVSKGKDPLLYWSAYGKSMTSNNEWWYRQIEHVTVKIYFYDSGSNTPINLNTAYLSLFSEDKNEGASSKISSNRYLYETTYMNYLASTSSQYTLRTYQNVFYGTVGASVDGNTEAGTLKCISFQYQNTNHIELELYALNTKMDVGYHFQYDSLTATIPTNPQKTVDKTTADTGDTITYTVTQNISKATDKAFYYSSLVCKDVLDCNLTYQSLTVYDENNKDITDIAGTTTYDSNTKTLIYTFWNSYLKNMNYKGQAYQFVIKAKVNSNVTSGTITNSSSTIINNNTYTLPSNKVTTQIPYKIIVNHVDKEGNKLADSETIIGHEGDKYITKAKDIYGYEVKQTPENSTGIMSENNMTVTYCYQLKDTNIVTKYVDEKGNEIADSEMIKGKVFDKYTTSAKDIYGYELIELPENNSGIMTEDTIVVTYCYQLKNTKVITKYIDEKGNEIADSQTIEGKVFDNYTTQAKNIYGYKLTETPINSIGSMTENAITVTYCYRKLQFNICVSQILSNIILNGETQNVSGKLEIDREVIVNSLKLTYTIKVSNNSELDGSTVLYDDIPDGYMALEEDNTDWIINGKQAYRKVENLNIGETKEFTIILTADSNEVMGAIVNTVSCKDSVCKVGFEETTLLDNIDKRELIISISTGLTEHTIEIFFEILVVLTVLVGILCKVRKNKKCKGSFSLHIN